MITNQVKTLQEKVKIMLTKYPEMRDSDKMLVTNFWYFELRRMGVDVDKAPISEFFAAYQSGVLSNADLITRARRKVQEENPDLRGDSWEERHKEARETRKTI
jgi:hypothetical protein